MDNFEWQKGYAMNFGLIAVNRETMERTPKPSLATLADTPTHKNSSGCLYGSHFLWYTGIKRG